MEVILYERPGCHLCEIALEKLYRLQKQYDFSIIRTNIDLQPELTEKFGLYIPVVMVDGEIVQFGQIDEQLIRKRLHNKKQYNC